jgi:hypothetical protein
MDCESIEVGSIPSLHPQADMVELADILVLETSEATHTGSTPVIGTLPFSSKDRTGSYELSDTRSIRVKGTQ